MRTLLMVGGPHDGMFASVGDNVTVVNVNGWSGVYRRKSLSASVEVLEHSMPSPDRWEPRRKRANFGVDRKPFTR